MTKTVLAIEGGTPVRDAKNPLPTLYPRRIGSNALKYYEQLIAGGNTKAPDVAGAFATLHGTRYALCMANCTVAIHSSLAAIGVGPYDEVVVSPITDYGTIYGILAQRAIPVFPDVDPLTGNITGETIAPVISSKTAAVLCVHWAGITCDMDGIMAVCRQRGIPVIEDCCQSILARYKGAYAGTIGDIGCFSFDNEKHLSCGSGGAAITGSSELYKRLDNFANARGSFIDDPTYGRRHKVLGCNYRFDVVRQPMAMAQLEELPALVERRRYLGALLTKKLNGIAGVMTSPVPAGGDAVYWLYPFLIDDQVCGADISQMIAAMRAEGLRDIGQGRYYLVPESHDLLNDLRYTYAADARPGGASDPYLSRNYSAEQTPHAKWYADHMVRFLFTEKYTEKDIDDIALIVDKVIERYRAGSSPACAG